MIERKRLEGGDAVELTFVLPAERAEGSVAVAGDFNGWDATVTPLQRSGDCLVATAVVDAGRRYAFRYFNEGAWFNDEAADAYEPNEFGGYDCVIDLT